MKRPDPTSRIHDKQSLLANRMGDSVKFYEGFLHCEDTMGQILPEIAAAILLVIAAVLVRKPLRSWRERREAERGRREFRRQREVLEARFFDLAAASGKPRGLRWVDCDWLETVTFARDKQTGLLTAFVAVNISFEAVEGGDMEDVAAVGNIRDAAAVFHYHKGNWGTGGRALFNMNPKDALDRLHGQFEPLQSAVPDTR